MKQIVTAKRQRFWDLRAAGNFIGGGTGTGLLLVSVVAATLGVDARIPMAAGAAFMLAGLSLVWLEIGKPWRALNVFFHPQTSWMTREGILAAPLAASAAAWVWLGHAALLPLIAVLAGGFLYCQARILKAARGIPAWKQQQIVPLIIACGLAEGSGLFLALGEASNAWITLALAAGLGREAAYAVYRRALENAKAPAATLESLDAGLGRMASHARWASLALLAAAWITPALAPVAGALLTLSGWGLKAVIVTRAAFTRGAAIQRTPVRGRGFSRTVEA